MADQAGIESIRFNGAFRHQKLTADFRPGLNLVHGKNGSGKTTLLHVLANLLECDLYRFCTIRFENVHVRLFDGTEIVLEQRSDATMNRVRVYVRGTDLGELAPTGVPIPDQITTAFAELFPARPVYLPAFRSILEAADEREQLFVYRDSATLQREFEEIKEKEEKYVRDRRARVSGRILENPSATAAKTIMSRRWFGSFVPVVRYPSVADVSRQLRSELEGAYFSVNRLNQRTFSKVFGEVLRVFEERVPQAGDQVRELLNRVQRHLLALISKDSQRSEGMEDEAQLVTGPKPPLTGEQESIRAILEIYESALADRAKREEEAYRVLRLLEASFNRFIEPAKALRILIPSQRRSLAPTVVFPNGYSTKLGVLSSGERQVLTMLFCATHMSPADGIMLIDEPEISLHVDWQRIILNEIMRQAGARQVIACTHSPEVAAEHRAELVKLSSEVWLATEGTAADSDNEAESGSGD